MFFTKSKLISQKEFNISCIKGLGKFAIQNISPLIFLNCVFIFDWKFYNIVNKINLELWCYLCFLYLIETNLHLPKQNKEVLSMQKLKFSIGIRFSFGNHVLTIYFSKHDIRFLTKRKLQVSVSFWCGNQLLSEFIQTVIGGKNYAENSSLFKFLLRKPFGFLDSQQSCNLRFPQIFWSVSVD